MSLSLVAPQDLAFAAIAQHAIVTGATLPSGVKVPTDGNWIIIGQCVANVPVGVPVSQAFVNH
jgi:hypothetical protein